MSSNPLKEPFIFLELKYYTLLSLMFFLGLTLRIKYVFLLGGCEDAGLHCNSLR